MPSAVAFLFYDAQSNILDDQKLEVENAIYVSAPDSGKNLINLVNILFKILQCISFQCNGFTFFVN